jgi:ketol-acid reductoisomerase
VNVAVLGYGHQGEAHALILRDAGWRVVIGARAGGAGEARARAAAFTVTAIAEAARGAEVVAVLIADEALAPVWPDIAGAVRRDATLVFAHGFNLHYGTLPVPAGVDVVLVSPTSPGRVMRAHIAAGGHVPGYLAVHVDASGSAWERAGRYARALGLAPLLRTTVREETEVDLFGEQAVLCGGMNALVEAAFDTLVRHGYAPELAYLECVHQLKYLAELLHERGLAGARQGISATALYGDLTRGPRVVGEPARAAMEELLGEIRSGAFAREWAAQVAAGAPVLERALGTGGAGLIEEARRRALGGDDGAH